MGAQILGLSWVQGNLGSWRECLEHSPPCGGKLAEEQLVLG